MSAQHPTEVKNDPVKLLDLTEQYATIKQDIDAAIKRVVDSQMFILGGEVEAFEKEAAQWLGVEHAIGCASGTDALILALMALELEPGSEVITTPYTFFATVSSITRTGNTPVFVDVEPAGYNLDVTKIEAAITDKTRAIIPVHIFGQTVDMGPLMELAAKYNLHVIEDNAQAMGATWSGKQAGAIGEMGCFSFFPAKNLGCFGDGGLICTHDEKQAKFLKELRVHGQAQFGSYLHEHIGINSRLDALQAAVLRAKLPYLRDWCDARSANGARYIELFKEAGIYRESGSPGRGEIVPPAITGENHVYHQYVARVHAGMRDGLLAHLRKRGIGCNVYYPTPLHLQPCFAYLGYKKGDMPVSETASVETIALPVYPELNPDRQQIVVDVIRDYLKANA